MLSTKLKVKGMSCAHCVASVKKTLENIEGLENVHVDLKKGEVTFDNTKAIAIEKIKNAIEEAGYEVTT